MRKFGLLTFAFAVACATGDTPGFSGSGAASFGTGGGQTDGSDGSDGSDTGADDDGGGSKTGSGPQTTVDPSADSGGNDDPTADTGMGDSTGGGADGPTCVPSEEVCDGDDNDCNGEIDEGDPGSGDACSTGLPGPCADGVTACQGGEIVCVQVTTPSAELCDGVDNDCNGTADDGDPEGGAACNTGMPGFCSTGTSACQGGTLACNQNQSATTEQCNGVDDDCNGTPDDGNPGGGGACSTGLQGICSAGTLQCQSGSVNCVQNQTSQSEICTNGIDENCNGVADDGCGCAHDVCLTGVAMVSGCSTCVTSICNADSYCCTTSWDSICTGEAESICGMVCTGTCSHSPCVTGVALVSGCTNCVSQVCGADSFCCSSSWDSICVGEVSSVCGLGC